MYSHFHFFGEGVPCIAGVYNLRRYVVCMKWTHVYIERLWLQQEGDETRPTRSSIRNPTRMADQSRLQV